MCVCVCLHFRPNTHTKSKSNDTLTSSASLERNYGSKFKNLSKLTSYLTKRLDTEHAVAIIAFELSPFTSCDGWSPLQSRKIFLQTGQKDVFFQRCFDLAFRDRHILKPEEFSIEWRAPPAHTQSGLLFARYFYKLRSTQNSQRDWGPREREKPEFSVCVCVRVLYLWFFRIFPKSDPNFGKD